MKWRNWLQGGRINRSLLLLRLWVGFGLFYKHGLEKILHFSMMQEHFPNLFHLGSTTALVFSLLSDSICSLLVILGLVTRLAALLIVINLVVVFGYFHHFTVTQDHSELVFLYLGVFLTLLVSGPGKYSLDHTLLR